MSIDHASCHAPGAPERLSLTLLSLAHGQAAMHLSRPGASAATMQAMLHRQSEEIQSLVQENQRILEELAYLRLQILSAANHQ